METFEKINIDTTNKNVSGLLEKLYDSYTSMINSLLLEFNKLYDDIESKIDFNARSLFIDEYLSKDEVNMLGNYGINLFYIGKGISANLIYVLDKNNDKSAETGQEWFNTRSILNIKIIDFEDMQNNSNMKYMCMNTEMTAYTMAIATIQHSIGLHKIAKEFSPS